ncbi:28S ribosomal protein S31, mitochondrial [Clonorchis sinensis]|uniref:Small ribosomal subunit protein mS31 n=1 Tax=Clonorchis sinensis TaxID=79923 RepID=A0A8T1M0A9_CLOSI|nr:28S ribosomal protein S31, mitochondrial [Clonorchis sinensis]
MLLHSNVPTIRPPWKIQQFFCRSFRVASRSNKGAEEDKNTTGTKPKTRRKASEMLGMFVDSAEGPYRTYEKKQSTKVHEKRTLHPNATVHRSSPRAENKQRRESDSSPSKPVVQASVLFQAFSNSLFVDRTERFKGLRFSCKLPEPSKLNLFVRDMSSLKACTETSAKEKSKCPVFDSLEVLELSLLSSIPLNQFDEWLLWTQEGKMWRFPIDNEQDWEELSVPFHEHTFLEKHLDKELLKCGPLSIFLELVCHGLAQNPHFTVEQKREHLKWYSSYFKDKVPAIEASVEEEKRLTELERKARGS